MVWPAVRAFSPTTSLAVLLSASANPKRGQPQVVQIADVEEAQRLGADAVVLFTALGGSAEADMIRMLAAVGREAERLALPLIAGAEFPTTYASVAELKDRYGFGYMRRNVRLCAELGANIIKTNWPWCAVIQAAGRSCQHYRAAGLPPGRRQAGQPAGCAGARTRPCRGHCVAGRA